MSIENPSPDPEAQNSQPPQGQLSDGPTELGLEDQAEIIQDIRDRLEESVRDIAKRHRISVEGARHLLSQALNQPKEPEE